MRMVLSAVLFSLAFSVDQHHKWYWISNINSDEVDWMFYVAGFGSILPLLLTWIGHRIWTAAAYCFRKFRKTN